MREQARRNSWFQFFTNTLDTGTQVLGALMTALHAWHKFGIFVLLPFAILVSAANDLRYDLWGEVTDAHLLSAVRGKPNKPNEHSVNVAYSFLDADVGRRTEWDKLPYWWDVPAGRSIKVRYIAGATGSSRVEGNHDWFWIIGLIFFAGLSLVIALSAWLRRKSRVACTAVLHQGDPEARPLR